MAAPSSTVSNCVAGGFSKSRSADSELGDDEGAGLSLTSSFLRFRKEATCLDAIAIESDTNSESIWCWLRGAWWTLVGRPLKQKERNRSTTTRVIC